MGVQIFSDRTASRKFDYSRTKAPRYRGLEKFVELERPILANNS
jgi:hypothetical protein